MSKSNRAMVAALVALALPSAVRAQFLTGLDGADYQGTPSNQPPNWTSVAAAGVKFAFVKATQGYSYTASSFAYNVKNATANGIMVGPYHFTDFDLAPTDPQDPIKQANHYLAVIKPYYDAGIYMPPVADVEGFTTLQSMGLLNKTYISNWVQSFSDTIYNSLGVRPIIYGSLSTVNAYYTSAIASTHPLWLAQWKSSGLANPPTASDTPLWGKWDYWQWTDNFPVNGITLQNPDGDVYGGTQAQLQAQRIGHAGGKLNGVTVISDFDADEGYYATTPFYSGSNIGVLTGTTADRTTAVAHRGAGSEKIFVNGDPASWNFRFVSGLGANSPATPGANLPLPATGSVGFWLKTANAGVTVSLNINDITFASQGALEGGVPLNVIADDQWRLYQWSFTDPNQWNNFFNGDGTVSDPVVTINSIVFKGAGNATLYMDDVVHNPAGSLAVAGDYNGDYVANMNDFAAWESGFGANYNGDDFLAWQHAAAYVSAVPAIAGVPEPATASLIAVALAIVCRRKSRR